MARALRQRGHEVTLVAYGLGEGEPEPGLRLVPVPVPEGYHNLRSGPDWVKPRLDLRMAQTMSRLDVDIVHAHHYEALAATLLARRLPGAGGWPVVYNNHTLLAEELPGYFQRGKRLFARAGALADATLPRRAHAVVAITPAAGARLRELGCRDTTVVPPGIHAEDFAGIVPRRAHDEPTVVYAGNGDHYQGLPLLFDAMARLPGWRLLVVTGSDDWTPPGATVIHTRRWADTRDWIAGADVAALPRQLPGGYPLKLLNYLASGVPTVVLPALSQGLPGEVVAAGATATSFARAIEAARAAGGGADLAAATVDAQAWPRRAAELEALYRRLLTGVG